jgi:hypothetical protein
MLLSHLCYTSGSSMFCLLTRFHLPNSHGLLVITMNRNAKYRFCIAAILFCIISPCNEIMVMLHDMTTQCADEYCICWLQVGLIMWSGHKITGLIFLLTPCGLGNSEQGGILACPLLSINPKTSKAIWPTVW